MSRVVRVAQNRALLFASIAAAVAILFFPAQQFVQQRNHISDLQTRLAHLHSENASLAKESKHLSDPSELELLARRRLGLVRPGERAYFIQETAPPVKQAPAARHRTNLFGRAWHWVTSLLRGRN